MDWSFLRAASRTSRVRRDVRTRAVSWTARALGSLLACSVAFSTAAQTPKDVTIALAGDIILNLPPASSPENRAVAELFQQADAAIANAEIPIIDLRSALVRPTSYPGALNSADPVVANYLADLGLDLVGVANNHGMDFGAEGVRETIRRLGEHGVVAAGYGETRASARAARYFSTSGGRVGLLSLTSTFAKGTEATDGVGELRGGPGLSVVRTTRVDIVSPQELQTIRAIRATHNAGLLSDFSPVAADEVALNGSRYKAGDTPATTYRVNQDDLDDIAAAIRTARERADYLVMSVHHHEEPTCPEPSKEDAGSAWPCPAPADFVTTIAHHAIDAGADVWMGHGPHILLGIEIYKGRPIFYSLGNLFMEAEASQNFRDRYPASLDRAKTGDLAFFRSMFGHYTRDPWIYETIVATCRYRDGKLVEVRLYPLDLRGSSGLSARGTPRRASREAANAILRRLQDLSKAYGTVIAIENGVGVIRIG